MPQPVNLRRVAPRDQTPLLLLILLHRRIVQQLRTQPHHLIVLLEELRQIKRLPPLIALLVKINRSHAILHILKIRRDIDHIIVTPHVPEQPDETPLAKLHKLLRDPHLIRVLPVEVIPNERIPGNARDMLLNQRVLVIQIIDPVRRKQMLQLQAINP